MSEVLEEEGVMIDRMFAAVTVTAIALQTTAVLAFFVALTMVTLDSFQIIQGPF